MLATMMETMPKSMVSMHLRSKRGQAHLIHGWEVNLTPSLRSRWTIASAECPVTRYVCLPSLLDQLGLAYTGLALFRIDDMQCRAGSPHAHLYFLPDVVDLPGQHVDGDR